ncbi:MAG TPA: thioredoxin family protein [Actinopolymorphaceae bacterium]|nr:thioredoxin family protein [Actinopolymorphaceae bacterium]
MAVESREIPLGTPAPDFRLSSVGGQTVALDDLTGPALLVAFMCNHCPYVRHIETAFGRLVESYASARLATVAISSNDVDAYPDDRPESLQAQADRAGWSFPYLVDDGQQVALAYGAACTPDLFLFDDNRHLAYHGAFDPSTPGNGLPVTGELLRDALELVLSGKPVPEPHRPAMGCSLKWKPGNEPI